MRFPLHPLAAVVLLASTAVAANPAPVSVSATLVARVSALPENSPAEKAKKTVLGVALERAEFSAGVDQAYASDLCKEVEGTLSIPADKMAAAVKDAPRVTAWNPVKVKIGNPYIDAIAAGVDSNMAKTDITLVKATPEVGAFDRMAAFYSVRNIGSQMEALWWLFANPASPRHDDPGVLRLFLRRALAYVDTLETQTAKLEAGQRLLDDFAIGLASGPLREFAQVYPGLLLPGQKRQWDAAMRAAADAMYGKARGREGRYANIDVTLACELSNFGLYLHDQKMLDQAKFLVEAQPKNIYPDGALAYINSQNETPTYQNTVLNYLTRYHKLWADDTSAAILARMRPYLSTPGGLSGFKVEAGGKTYVVWANPTSGTLPCVLPDDPALARLASLHLSQDPANLTGVTGNPVRPAPAQVELKAHEQAVWVASADPADHIKGWTDFPEMLAHQPATPTP